MLYDKNIQPLQLAIVYNYMHDNILSYRLLGRFEYPQVLVFTLKIKMVIPPLRSSVTSGHIKNIESNLNHIK